MDNTNVQTMKTHKKLGFTHLETAEIVRNINTLHANYQIHYQKLRNFHWNVEGSDFFELHEKFEEDYHQVAAHIDELAERVRVFGKRPLSTLTEYLNNSEISEVDTQLTSFEMVKEILNDYEILLTCMLTITEAANKIGDAGTIDIINSFIKKMEKRHWMYTAWLKNPKPHNSAQ